MHDLLKSKWRGQQILHDYEKNQILSPTNRAKLVELIVDEAKLQNFEKGNNSYSFLSEKISKLFPNEKKESIFFYYCFHLFLFYLLGAHVLYLKGLQHI